MNTSTPTSFKQASNYLALERALTVHKNRRIIRNSIIWGSLNVLVLAILLYDISNTCPLHTSYFDYFEYALMLIFTLNVLYYMTKVLVLSVKTEQVPITLEQKKLLGIKDSDNNFKIVDCLDSSLMKTPNQSLTASPMSTPTSLNITPMNLSALSWRSNLSPSDSLNYSMASPSWTYHKMNLSAGQMPSFQTESPLKDQLQYRDTSGIEFISDESDLEKYLRDFESTTNRVKATDQTVPQTNLLSSFWSHPVTKTAKEMSSFLKSCRYQLSSPSPTGASTKSPKGGLSEDKSPGTMSPSCLVAWSPLSVDIVALTRWNENLRKWISQTILERLVAEFDSVDESLEKQGLGDIKVGAVGLDRLRKTAQIGHIAQYVSSLATMIPFLEVSTNQEYLVQRIRELSKGGCMSEFKWNGGSSYNSKEWDESLPTDAAIIMHLFASYLDTQLMPVPNMPDTKPFSGHFYLKSKDKLPTLTPNSLFIQQMSERPPHFRVIVGETVYDMAKGYNNLFHSILFFLYNVNVKECGMLGRVNLGRAGVNMLWIIDQNQ